MLKLINEFSKIAKYKINIEKLVAFYIPITNYQKQKLRKQSHLQLHKKIKYPGVNYPLFKEVRDLY